MKKIFLILFLFCVSFTACSADKIPDGVSAVGNFSLERYLGRWYEIARLDHSFERGLSNVSAQYSTEENGSVMVLNRGFKDSKGEWEEARGIAYPLSADGSGRLKVSFFRPFYASYNIIDLDSENYSYSMVCGPDRSYLWILSRDKNMDMNVLEGLKEKARTLGFPVEELIMVNHQPENERD